MSKLDEVYRQCQGSALHFKHRAILFIGSESYDAPTITVLQGLHKLGFTIYTLKKPNINSWFCNRVLDSVDHLRFDFVLSNLHWGTRWGYYERYKLWSYPKILIDGDDNHGKESWKAKYARYVRSYVYDPPEALKDRKLHPYRWVEPLGDYKPDMVFTAQKVPGDKTTFYLPFGIHEQYMDFCERRATHERDINFAYIPGPGVRRKREEGWVRRLSRYRLLPGRIHNSPARGEEVTPEEIRECVAVDNNVHSYHRWTTSKVYFRILNRAKVLIYPGVSDSAWWDSKRPWEAYASGCLVLLGKQTIDMAEYPATEICEFPVYDSYMELATKCWVLYLRPSFLDELRLKAVERAWKYFSPVPIARYFLARVAASLN
jgi:hypothetical protein